MQEYTKSLHETKRKMCDIETLINKRGAIFKNALNENDVRTIDGLQRDYEILKDVVSDLRFVISWIKKGFQPNAHYRGIERNDAYYIMRPYDPSILERYIENKQAGEPYEDVEEEVYGNQKEKEEKQRIAFEEKLTREMAELLEKAKDKLTRNEKDILLLLEQKKPQSEIAQMVGVSQQAVSKTIKRIKKKLQELGIERDDL